MKVIPFRITESTEPDNFNTIYNFLIKGSDKDPYEIEIEIDEFNDTGFVESRCNCYDWKFRRLPNCKRFVSIDYECKHITEGKRVLVDFGIKIDYGVSHE